MTQHPLDDLQSFALGDLDRASAEAVLGHADGCAACAAELADMMRGVAALAQAEGERGVGSRRRTLRLTRSGWVAGLATAAALLLAAWNVQLHATGAPIDALVNSHFAHHALMGEPGRAKIVYALDGSWVYVIADGLAPLHRYEVDVDGAAIGEMRADFTGRASGYWTRAPGKVTGASLIGDGATLRW